MGIYLLSSWPSHSSSSRWSSESLQQKQSQFIMIISLASALFAFRTRKTNLQVVYLLVSKKKAFQEFFKFYGTSSNELLSPSQEYLPPPL